MSLTAAFRNVRQTINEYRLASLSDAELLDHFRQSRDESAFEVLAWRYAPLVRRACSQALADDTDIDDAFQATFLVFIRKIDSIRNPNALGAWLCRIALRTSRKLAARKARRREFSPARRRLKKRLELRGVRLSAQAIGLLLAGRANAATREQFSILVESMFGEGPGGLSDRAISLMEGAVRDMWMNKAKTGGLVLLAALVIGVGVGRWTSGTVIADPLVRKQVLNAPEPEPRANADDRKAVPAPQAIEKREVVLPIGIWERDNGLMRVRFQFTQDRMFGSITMIGDGSKITMEFDGDYAMNRENVVFGIITGVDMNTPGINPDKIAEASEMMLIANDQPFSFRIRLDDNVMSIKDIRFLGLGGPGAKDDDGLKSLYLMMGRYKKVTREADRERRFDRD